MLYFRLGCSVSVVDLLVLVNSLLANHHRTKMSSIATVRPCCPHLSFVASFAGQCSTSRLYHSEAEDSLDGGERHDSLKRGCESYVIYWPYWYRLTLIRVFQAYTLSISNLSIAIRHSHIGYNASYMKWCLCGKSWKIWRGRTHGVWFLTSSWGQSEKQNLTSLQPTMNLRFNLWGLVAVALFLLGRATF